MATDVEMHKKRSWAMGDERGPAGSLLDQVFIHALNWLG